LERITMNRPAYTTPTLSAWRPASAPLTPTRRWVARLLRRTGAMLRLAAARLASPAAEAPMARVPMTLPRLEFHADAGAPEGALYVDGDYVGHLDVTRL